MIGTVVWLTGLSGAGKSTIARCLAQELTERGRLVYVIDGDDVRGGLCADLGFSSSDRSENVRRVAHVARIIALRDAVAVVALISPNRADRQRAREICASGFFEVFIQTSLETCERRDPKGLYRRARVGEINEFTGVSAPYEAPELPEVIVDCENVTAPESCRQLLSALDVYESGLRRALGGSL